MTTVGFIAVAIHLVACDSVNSQAVQKDRPQARRRPTSPAALTAPPPSATSHELSTETRRTIAQVRNRIRRITPNGETERRLEFFGVRLARLTRNALYITQLSSGPNGIDASTKTAQLADGREIARLADNALVVVAKTATLLFDSEGNPRGDLGKIAYFPGMQLLPELRFPYAFSTFDSRRATYSLYRYDTNPNHPRLPAVGAVWLPHSEADLPPLANSICTLLNDGTYACTDGTKLLAGFPGLPPKELGMLDRGATVVRLLPGPRADRVRVLRSDASLEEYWAIAPAKRLSRMDLPWVPFHVATLKSATAVLVLDSKAEQEVRLWLTVIEPDGKSRWKAPLDAITTPNEARDFDRELYSCRSLAVHPQKPWIAVSNCQSIQVFDAQTGARIATIENVPF